MHADQRAKRDAFLGKIGAHPVVTGILNLTPDSFSDGQRFVGAVAALSQAKRMEAEGCGIIDVGGESTRPAAWPVTEIEELARVQRVLAELGRREVPTERPCHGGCRCCRRSSSHGHAQPSRKGLSNRHCC